MATKDPREERISKMCAEINKSDYGGDDHNAVMWLGSRDAVAMERWPTGCPDLDDALGGGLPKGRQIEIFGVESGGKTTLCLHAIAEHQKKYPEEDCALIDSEYAFDETYAIAIGVDTKYLIVNQPDSGEQALSVLIMLIERGVSLVIVDSVAALVPEAEMEDEGMGGGGLGVQARMMSQGLRRINTEAGKRNATILWTNQMREKIGVMFGDPKTTPAGRALKHYSSVRIDIRSVGKIKEKVDGEDVVVSNKTMATVVKNKTAPPFRKAEFSITYGIGIDRVAGAFDRGIALGIIEKRGSWVAFDGENLAQGRMNVINLLREDEDLMKRIESANAIATGEGKVIKSPKESSPKPIVGRARVAVKRPTGQNVEVTDV